MPAEKLQLPVGGKMRKSGSAKNLSIKSPAKSPTLKHPPPMLHTNRSQVSNLNSVRRGGRIVGLDGRVISATDNPEVNVSIFIVHSLIQF